MTSNFVIVGGSYAAYQMAVSARENGFDGGIFIVTEEAELPYHRPPLSKAFLQSGPEKDELPLKSGAFYRDQDIDVLFNTRVNDLDMRFRTISFDNGWLKFDQLGIATGAKARLLDVPGSELDGVLYLRSINDARALRQRAGLAEDIVVIGGGFIGLEVASALVGKNKCVTVIESQARPLARAVAPAISEFIANVHRENGVRILCNTGVREIIGNGNAVVAVECEDGRTIRADIVLVGVGAQPNTELAEIAGLNCQNGIIVDGFSRTSNTHIVAAGDCAFYAGPFTPRGARLESVQNALDQAKSAGASAAGVRKEYTALPWFWSDQYELKLQMAGLSAGYDSVVERRFDDVRQLNLFYFHKDVCIAVDSINRPRDHMLARRQLSQRAPTKGDLMNVDFAISELRP